MDNLDGVSLAETMNPPDSLLKSRRVPGWLKIHYCGGCLQVQPNSAGVRRKKHPATRILAESDHQIATLSSRHVSVQRYPTESEFRQLLADEERHAFVLAEDDHLPFLMRK